MQTQAPVPAQVQTLDLARLTKTYWKVSRCWHDSKRSVRENMTFEKAVTSLREIHFGCLIHKEGDRLGARALRLLAEIVENQVDPSAGRLNGTSK